MNDLLDPERMQPEEKPREGSVVVSVDPAKPESQSTAVAVYDQTQQMVTSIIEMASNPDVDADKIEKLLDIQMKMMDRQAKMDFDQALARVQSTMPRITERGEIKNKHGQVTSTYMKYEDIDLQIRPRLQAEGFSLMHTRDNKDGKMIVTTTLKHVAGHEESVSMPLPYDKENQLKNAVQAAVSTFSYGKRVNVCSLLNIVAEGDDDDGQMAAANPITEEQAASIKKRLQDLYEAGDTVDTGRFVKLFGANSVDEIPAASYGDADQLLKRKENALKESQGGQNA